MNDQSNSEKKTFRDDAISSWKRWQKETGDDGQPPGWMIKYIGRAASLENLTLQELQYLHEGLVQSAKSGFRECVKADIPECAAEAVVVRHHDFSQSESWTRAVENALATLRDAGFEELIPASVKDGQKKHAGKKQKQLALENLFAEHIGVPVKNSQWPWGVFDRENNRVILPVWEDEIDAGSDPTTVYIAKTIDDPGHGAERKTQLELMQRGAAAYAIVCVAETKSDGSQGIARYYEDVAQLGELEQREGKTYAFIERWESLSTIFRSPSASDDLVNDIRKLSKDKSIDDTTRETLVSARIGQGQFRADVLRLWQNSCAVTGVSIPECLRASHIRPWRESTNEQRLDPDNGLPLVGTLDLLFDRGLIAFEDDGGMIISSLVTDSQREKLKLTDTSHLRMPPSPETAIYLRWHREQCFRTAANG